jgi:hypothetical protein
MITGAWNGESGVREIQLETERPREANRCPSEAVDFRIGEVILHGVKPSARLLAGSRWRKRAAFKPAMLAV